MSPDGGVIVIATKNPGKVKEFAYLFHHLNKRVVSLADYPDIPEVVEDGASFAENAEKKARTIAEQLHVPVLADDSGLCVDALGGEPGIYSARYAGVPSNAALNNNKLIRELKKLPSVVKNPVFLSTARFVCVLTLVDPLKDRMIRADGECEGIIINEPRGSNGFGYDPLFYLPQFGRTMAEMTVEEKNKISHRAMAMKEFLRMSTEA